jgi:3-oxoacyl-[acyl-carrier protein] reductase
MSPPALPPALPPASPPATGIGVAVGRRLGELGAAVLLTATTDRAGLRAAELRAAGIDAAAVVADLTEPAAGARLVDAALGRWGRLDVLVNNAGMVSVSDPDPRPGGVADLDYEGFRASLARNLDTAFLVTKAALPGLLAGGWGRIVMVSSLTGPVMAIRADAAYAAAKAALLGLTRSLAVDLAPRGVTVNAVAPGWIATGSQTEAERIEGRATPIGRSGEPAEVAWPVAWLCTPGASYVTGQCLVIDGGNSVSEQRG